MRIILRRLGVYALTAWVAITVTFFLPRLMPGNPHPDHDRQTAGEMSRGPRSGQSNSPLGGSLHESLIHQYFTFLNQLLHGNLGDSITKGAW